jgi:hypothetical protein
MRTARVRRWLPQVNRLFREDDWNDQQLVFKDVRQVVKVPKLPPPPPRLGP